LPFGYERLKVRKILIFDPILGAGDLLKNQRLGKDTGKDSSHRRIKSYNPFAPW
jgi:hypothetical protein